jgi:hypothetical protein
MNELERLEALNEHATPMPVDPPNAVFTNIDRQYIAAARNALPDLLAVAQAARRQYHVNDAGIGCFGDPDDGSCSLCEALAPLLREIE